MSTLPRSSSKIFRIETGGSTRRESDVKMACGLTWSDGDDVHHHVVRVPCGGGIVNEGMKQGCDGQI